ncbi:hypothetical protein [Streptomyces sp. NPDC047968]|uniref:hypothetical protein n=1 Tax=unclassified Streptomyces TaxID=2593676 RepID=UPI0034424822
MTTPDETRCERPGCRFSAEIVLIDGAPYPARFCGDGCRDWHAVRLLIDAAPNSREKSEALLTLEGAARKLDARQEPYEIRGIVVTPYE